MYEENYGKRRAYYERRKKRRRKIIARRFLCTALVAACIVGAGIGIKQLLARSGGPAAFPTAKKTTAAERLQKIEIPDFIDPQLIHVHTTARTGTQLEDINNRNKDTISIEVCHPDGTGKFNDATYTSVVKLTAWLLKETGLSGDNVIRHYDVTGKLCPIYYVNNPDKWEAFKKDVKTSLAELKEK